MPLRPADLAAQYGLSTQAVRNYEEAGFLPPAERSLHGYRRFTARHSSALGAFLALRGGFGHAVAGEIMARVNAGDVPAALRVVDESHAALLRDRRTLDEVAAAVTALAALDAPVPPIRPEAARTVGEVAHQLGLHPATLRKWEEAGVLHPPRDRAGYRRFGPADLRDARLAAQLRRGGYPLARISRVVAQLNGQPEARVGVAGGSLEETLTDGRVALDRRALAMLRGAAALAAHLEAE